MPGNGIFTPGPILHFVVIPQYSQTNAFFLGTSVTSPKQRQKLYEIPVMNDLGGRSARFQSVNDGEEWDVFTTLNRFDLNVVRALRYLKSGIAFTGGAFPNPAAFPLGGTTPPLGTQTGQARGTLVMGVQDFQLILINSYGGTLAAGQPLAAITDLNTARAFSSCSLTACEDDDEATRALELGMVIECRGLFNAATRGFINYTESLVLPPFIGGQQITLGPVT